MKNFFLLLLVFTSLKSSSQESYEDSVRSERVKHFSELTDTSKHILKQEEIDEIESLDYFLVDKKNIISATFTVNKGKKFKMPTTTERQPIYRRYGYLDFEIDGKKCRLSVYQNQELKRQKEFKKHLFLPFRDLTSGSESYGGGRFLDLTIPEGTVINIDFNFAYNPYCAYSYRYSCPIPPKENTLEVRIEAGEKTPKTTH